MADTNNLGTYQNLFFKLGGIDKSVDEYSSMTKAEDLSEVKKTYDAWVAKYINTGSENAEEPKTPIEAENSYFAKREEEQSKTDTETQEGRNLWKDERQKLDKEYEAAGWKKITVDVEGIIEANFKGGGFSRHFNPAQETEEEAMSRFREEISTELKADAQKKKEDEPLKENDENKKDDVLNVNDAENNVPAPENENTDWIADEEKFWKEGHCDPKGYTYARNPEQTEGLEFDIYKTDEDRKNKTPSTHIHYKNPNNVVVGGKDGGVPDYEDLYRLVEDAKRNGKSINFEHIKTPEFAAKLKLACEELDVKYQNAPEGKIDAKNFEGQLSPESKAKLAAYNAGIDSKPTPEDEKKPESKDYDAYAKEMAEKAKNGDKEFDLAGLEGAEAAKALAAAKVAGLEVKNAPEYVDYNGGKIVEGEDGKKHFEKSEMSEALKDLPDEAKQQLTQHNLDGRKKQIDAARAKMTPENQTAREEKETKREERRSQPGMDRISVAARFKANDGH